MSAYRPRRHSGGFGPLSLLALLAFGATLTAGGLWFAGVLTLPGSSSGPAAPPPGTVVVPLSPQRIPGRSARTC